MNSEYRVDWWGGPLDGCVKETGFIPPWWTGPDVGDPTKPIWYELTWMTPKRPRYIFRPQGPPTRLADQPQ